MCVCVCVSSHVGVCVACKVTPAWLLSCAETSEHTHTHTQLSHAAGGAEADMRLTHARARSHTTHALQGMLESVDKDVIRKGAKGKVGAAHERMARLLVLCRMASLCGCLLRACVGVCACACGATAAALPPGASQVSAA
jgi:hypothetical protein